ncbi:MAG: class I SAM-dependent methyltransferase [Acidithiobacillus sp.]
MSARSLRTAYGIWAPIYDAMVAGFSAPLRRRSLAHIPSEGPSRILLVGVGTGLDLPYIPKECITVGLDLTHGMLLRARGKGAALLVEGDCEALPFADTSFDTVVLHLILAVTAHAAAALREAARVLRPGGQILVLDKFLRPGQSAPLRRLVGPLLGPIATHTDLIFEEILANCPDLHCIADDPAAVNGWFRLIRLQKAGPQG